MAWQNFHTTHAAHPIKSHQILAPGSLHLPQFNSPCAAIATVPGSSYLFQRVPRAFGGIQGAPLSAQAPSGRYAAALCSAATLLYPKRSRRSLAKVRPAEVLRGTPDPIKLQRPSSSTPLTAGGTSSLHRLKTSTLAPASVAKLLTFPHLLYCTNRDAFRAQVTWTFLPFAAS
jgi:hypothetical protein